MPFKHELQSIISGNGQVRNGEIIQTITKHLRRKKETIQGTQKEKILKWLDLLHQTKLIETINLWLNVIVTSNYNGKGHQKRLIVICEVKY